MMKSLTHLSLFAVAFTAVGCGFAARSPEQYRSDTAAVLETKNVEVKQCYDEILKRDPNVSGTVAIKFTVQEDTGQFMGPAVDASGTTAPEPLTQCVLQAMSNLTLSPPDANDGQATFVYEFRVNPAAEPAPPLPPG
jgi:hypothetical protein